MKKKEIIIKPAKIKNIKEIVDIIKNESLNSTVIKKSYKRILGNYKNFLVALDGEKVVGTIGFKSWSGVHIEIVSLVVDRDYRGEGLGVNLIKEIIAVIKKRGHKKAFVLTEVIELFKKFGFTDVDIKIFPQKILNDCKYCPRNAGGPDDPLCNEKALQLNI